MLENQNLKLVTRSLEKINIICDYCGDIYQKSYCDWYKKQSDSQNINKKDACKKCRSKKREETSMMKYGVRVPSQAAEIKSKASKTKGGTGIVVSNLHDEIINLYVDDMSVARLSKILNVGKTALISYMRSIGLDTTGDKIAKKQKTNLKRYGVKEILQSEQGQKKIKETLKERYGNENPYKNSDYKNNWKSKTKKTCLERYGVSCIIQDPNRKLEFDNKRRITRVKNGQIIVDDRTAIEIAEELGIATSTFYERIQKWGLELAISKEKHTSALEYKMRQWLDSENINYETQVYICGKIADFVIGNVIIETDGLYYHSDAVIKNSDYHVEKRQVYIDNGYIPLFFYENEIYNQFDIVKSIILNKLNCSTKIYARKCKICEVDKTKTREFITQNHLMGPGFGKGYGLYYNNELISILQTRRLKDGTQEISRFAHKLNTSVIGGFSKLIKHIQSICNLPITTFIDLRYGNGNYLTNLGFQHKGTHKSFKWTNCKRTFHRMKFPSSTGYENGMFKIWDCGQAKFIKQL